MTDYKVYLRFRGDKEFDNYRLLTLSAASAQDAAEIRVGWLKHPENFDSVMVRDELHTWIFDLEHQRTKLVVR